MRTGAVISLILLAAIVTGGVMLSGAAADAADECVSAANEAGTLCIMEDWTRAEALTADYAAKWKASRALLDLLLPKEMLDSVTEAYAELGTCSGALRRAGRLRGMRRTCACMSASRWKTCCDRTSETDRSPL